jgi:N-acetyl sugar amidotransferase
MREYRICTRCIMDTSDSEILFDGKGVCRYCLEFEATARRKLEIAQSGKGMELLSGIIEEIKRKGKNKEYDSIVGVSGGVDSTYATYNAVKFGLRPLAVHFDSGWNSELAVNNIEHIVKRLNIDLHTVVADWPEMQDLQLAYFKASVANCDIPQDHAFVAALYDVALEQGIRYIIVGGNIATEFILPKSWGYNSADLCNLKAIQRRFGTMKLKRYPTCSFFQRYVYYPFIKGIKVIRILDYLPYNKQEGKKLISKKLGWRDYGGKHYESIFTRFFQACYLPKKFGFDKRRAHLSSLVVSGQMTRDQALTEMDQPPDPPAKMVEDGKYVAKKLGITYEEFERIIDLPIRSYKDFPSSEWLFQMKDFVLSRTRSRIRR